MSRSTSHCDPSDHPVHHAGGADASPFALDRASRIFRAMGDAARLRILHLLMGGECCVTEIVEAVGEKFSTVSQPPPRPPQ